MYNDGGVEKYEGIDAFNFIEQIIQKYRLENLPPKPTIVQPAIKPPILKQAIKPVIKTETQPKKPELIVKPVASKNISKILDPEDDDTDIVPVPAEEHSNVEIEDLFPPPKASLRTGPGSYETAGEFGTKKTETKVTKGIKPVAGDLSGMGVKKGGRKSVMEAAMEMQKSRENELDSTPRVPFQ